MEREKRPELIGGIKPPVNTQIPLFVGELGRVASKGHFAPIHTDKV